MTKVEAYKIRLEGGTLVIHMSDGIWSTGISLVRLIEGLRECGYQITEPPSEAFTEIRTYLDASSGLFRTQSLGDTLFVYYHSDKHRTITIAAVGHQVELNIDNEAGHVFVGYVLSLDEFKLIWDRIL